MNIRTIASCVFRDIVFSDVLVQWKWWDNVYTFL